MSRRLSFSSRASHTYSYTNHDHNPDHCDVIDSPVPSQPLPLPVISHLQDQNYSLASSRACSTDALSRGFISPASSFTVNGTYTPPDLQVHVGPAQHHYPQSNCSEPQLEMLTARSAAAQVKAAVPKVGRLARRIHGWSWQAVRTFTN